MVGLEWNTEIESGFLPAVLPLQPLTSLLYCRLYPVLHKISMAASQAGASFLSLQKRKLHREFQKRFCIWSSPTPPLPKELAMSSPCQVQRSRPGLSRVWAWAGPQVAGIELARPWARTRAIYSMKHDVKEAPADKPAFLRKEKAPLQKRKSNRCDY